MFENDEVNTLGEFLTVYFAIYGTGMFIVDLMVVLNA